MSTSLQPLVPQIEQRLSEASEVMYAEARMSKIVNPEDASVIGMGVLRVVHLSTEPPAVITRRRQPQDGIAWTGAKSVRQPLPVDVNMENSVAQLDDGSLFVPKASTTSTRLELTVHSQTTEENIVIDGVHYAVRPTRYLHAIVSKTTSERARPHFISPHAVGQLIENVTVPADAIKHLAPALQFVLPQLFQEETTFDEDELRAILTYWEDSAMQHPKSSQAAFRAFAYDDLIA